MQIPCGGFDDFNSHRAISLCAAQRMAADRESQPTEIRNA